MSRKTFKELQYKIIMGLGVGTLLFANSCVFAADKHESLKAGHIVYDDTNVLIARYDVRYVDDEYELKAKTIHYNTEKEMMTAEDSVTVTLYKLDKSGNAGILTADKIQYNKKENIVVANGNVILKAKNNEIKGNKLEYQRNLHCLIVTEDVSYKNKDGDTVLGSRLQYDTEKEEGQIENFVYAFSENEILYHSWGNCLTFSDTRTLLEKANLTTCNLKQPHYSFSAQKAEYYPKKKLILWGISDWEKNKKTVSVKKIVIPFHEKESAMPEVGYSDEEGSYIKTKDYFDVEGKNYGVIYRDYMTRRGIGYGVRKYFFTEDGKKQIYLYAAHNPLASNRTLKGEWRIQNRSQDQMLSVEDDKQNERDHDLTAKWSYLGKGQKTTTTADIYSFSQSGRNDQSNINSRFSQSIRNSNELRTYLSYNFYRSNYRSRKYQDRNGTLLLEYTQPQYIAQLSSEEHKYGLDYIPKFNVQTTLSSPFQFEVSTARVSRNYSDFSVQQSELISHYNSDPLKIAKSTFLQTNFNAKRTFFSDNNNLMEWNGSVNFLTNLNARLYTNTSLKHSQGRGFNPLYRGVIDSDLSKFIFDINYRFDDNYRMRLDYDYDMRKNMLNSLTINVDGRTYPFWNWSLNGGYSGRDGTWKNIGAYVTLNPDSKIMGYIKFDYNLEDHAFTEASIRLEGNVFDVWQYSIKTDYARYNSLATVSELKFTRNLHCRDLVFTAYPHENKYFLEMVLKN